MFAAGLNSKGSDGTNGLTSLFLNVAEPIASVKCGESVVLDLFANDSVSNVCISRRLARSLTMSLSSSSSLRLCKFPDGLVGPETNCGVF